MGNVILIGFMGCGKSSIAVKLSYRLKQSVVDTDRWIEKKQGRTITEIFAQDGEAAFRQMETEALQYLKEHSKNQIISVGGGLPVREENRKLMKEIGKVVYLRATADTIYERVKEDGARPLLQGENPKERIVTLMEQRKDAYEGAADLIVDVDGKNFGQILFEIERGLRPAPRQNAGYQGSRYERGSFEKSGFEKNSFERGGYEKGGFERSDAQKGAEESKGQERSGYERNSYERSGRYERGNGGYERSSFKSAFGFTSRYGKYQYKRDEQAGRPMTATHEENVLSSVAAAQAAKEEFAAREEFFAKQKDEAAENAVVNESTEPIAENAGTAAEADAAEALTAEVCAEAGAAAETAAEENAEAKSEVTEKEKRLKKLLVINGPNLNFLGIREKSVYGTKDYNYLLDMIARKGLSCKAAIEVFQSNHEGAIIDRIQAAYFDGTEGIVINPGAYTHYSYAIHDALASITVPKVEIHISNIMEREAFRRVSVTAPACDKQIYGHGLEGYLEAIDFILSSVD